MGSSEIRIIAAKLCVPPNTGLIRTRLLHHLARVHERGVAVVAAPAGSGKSTLLSQFAAMSDMPVGWYRAESSEGQTPVLLAHLQHAFAIDGPAWASVEEAAEAIHAAATAGRRVVVIDDFHALAGTPAEAACERLIGYLPRGVAVVIGSRWLPGFDLDRLRLADRVVELGHNDLRFRTWEVEELFGHYGDRLRPEDLAELTRRTEGWAAGLQFFHLALRGRPGRQRSRLLDDLAGSAEMFREYLARNVVADLPRELRSFMVRTSPLGWLDGPLCDAFLGTTGSRRLLADAEARQVFTERVAANAYRYHEVFRAYLEEALVDELGEDAARTEHRRAAALLEDAGRVQDAVRAYGRAEDWASVVRLASDAEGPQLAATGVALPGALAREPWALLAGARALLCGGQLAPAIARYAEAERAFGRARGADTCARERTLAAAWIDRVSPPGDSWLAVLRRATMQHPLAATQRPPDEGGSVGALTSAIALMLGGRLRAARVALRAVAEAPETSSLVAAVASVAGAVGAVVAGDTSGAMDFAWTVETLEPQVDWLAHLAWGLAMAGTQTAVGDVDIVRRRCRDSGNAWGSGLATIIEILLWLGQDDRPAVPGGELVAAAEETTELFRALGAGVFEAWTEALRATLLAVAGDAAAPDVAAAAERMAAVHGTDLARHQALVALVVCDAASEAQRDRLRELINDHGLGACRELTTTGRDPAVKARPAGAGAGMDVHCFGGLRLAVDGRPVELPGAKPRVRSLLRLLAMSAGRTVHRDAIIDALWPDQDVVAATRSLQVAVSAVRQLLEPGVPRGASGFLVRDGEGYVLGLGVSGRADVSAFDAAVAEGRRCFRAADRDGAGAAMTRALELYCGPLFPEEGAADWVVKERQRYEMDAADAAACLGACLLEAGDLSGAVHNFERSLQIDRYRDGVWRQLIAAAERAGDRALATRATRAYEAVLADLDVAVP